MVYKRVIAVNKRRQRLTTIKYSDRFIIMIKEQWISIHNILETLKYI